MKFRMLVAALALVVGAFAAEPAIAQGCGSSNPNCIVPTAPRGTSDNRAASTAFVQQNGGYSGLSGDCTATSLGVITCTKTNGTPFGTMAVQNGSAVSITGGTITGMPSPAAASDVATKNYVDSIASGITVLAPSGLATAAVLPNSPTYSNGASGVGATLTAGSNTTLTVDGTAAPLNTVVLVKNQASAFQNGIYTVTQAGSGSLPWILTRATYFDQAAEMKAGSYTLVTGGAVNAGSAFTLQTAVTTVGTDPLTWLLFSQGSGGVAAGAAVIATRASALTQNLSAYTSLSTQGYATAGDGGGATFKNVGSTKFRDSFVTGITISANGTGSCTNGSYLAKQPTGGSGTNLTVNVTVAGNVVSAVTVEDTGGNGYTVGNVLTITGITGCSGSVTVTVSTVSTPTGSFIDAAGNNWQIIYGDGNFINVKQFGAKVDYAGVDATATDDRVAIQNAYSFASDIHSPTIDGGGSAGARVIHPPGNSLVCGSIPLLVPQGVHVEGNNMWASTLKQCATWSDSVHFMVICDPDTHVSCFASYLRNLTLYAQFTQTANSNIAMIYSNSIQQVDVLDRVAIYAGRRQCIYFETGYGGAALLGMQNVECTPGSGGTNSGIKLNYGTTLVTMRNVHVETSGPQNILGLEILGGFVDLVGFHSEGIVTPIFVNIPTSNTFGMVRIHTVTGGAGCSSLITRQAGSGANTVIAGHIVAGNGCTNTVNNAGALTTTAIVADTVY